MERPEDQKDISRDVGNLKNVKAEEILLLVLLLLNVTSFLSSCLTDCLRSV